MTKTERLREWRAKNPERYKATAKKWRIENQKHIQEWRVKNHEHIKTQKQKWQAKNRAKNPGHHVTKNREWAAKSPAKYVFSYCKARAKHVKRPFTLTLLWVERKLAVGICERTGLPFVFNKDPLEDRNPWFPSIDRIDSSLGYTEANCQMVCIIYNLAKSNWTDADMLKMAKSLVNNVDLF